MSGHALFFVLDYSSGSGRADVNTAQDKDSVHRAVLIEWVIIKGAPVTAGVPDSPFYNIAITGTRSNLNIIRNDNRPGMPIPLKGSYTFHEFTQPVYLAHEMPAGGSFTLNLTDSTGNPAIASQVILFCRTQ